jgi:hypothetical protein
MSPAPPPPSSGPMPAPVQGKKSNALLWVLLGVGGFFVLVIVALVGVGFFVVHKAKEAGFDRIHIEDGKKGKFEVKSADGSVQFGGEAKIPAWLPDYPGSNPENAFSAQGNNGRTGTFVFKTGDSPDHVAQFYREQLESSGLKVASVVNAGESQIVTAADSDKHRTVNVVVAKDGSETSVNITYATK